MSIIFKPNGTLNLAQDASDFLEEIDSGNIKSYDMQRCKNLRLDLQGVAKTRYGSARINTAIGTPVCGLIEQGGYRYSFGGGAIYKNETSIGSGYSQSNWSAMLYNAFNDTTQDIFCTDGATRKRIEAGSVYEWGITAPTAAPVITAGAKTGLSGSYKARYTYCRKSGSTVICESNPSPEVAAAVALTNGSLSVTWAASTDGQVTHVRVYRTLLNGDTYYLDTDVAIGTLTLDTNTADGSLGAEVSTTHTRPPLGATFLAGPNYNGTCFAIVGNLLYYCLPKQPEYWPSTYYIEVSAPQFSGQCLIFYNGQPYFITKSEIHQIQGTGHLTFFPYRMNAVTGAQSRQGAVGVQGKGIFHVGSDGIYCYTGSMDKKITQLNFEPIFRGETVNGVPGAGDLSTSWLMQYENRLYFGYAGINDVYPSNVLVFNMDTGRTTYYTYGTEIVTVAVNLTGDRLMGIDRHGYVWILELANVTTDNDAAISWECESKNFMLQTRAHFPRWCKYDVDASGADSATGQVVLDGVVHQSHVLTGNRNTRKRLVKTGNGSRQSFRLSGTGPVSIYMVEGE